MPKGPNGQKRPADTGAAAMMVARIATGEEVDTAYKQSQKVAGARKGGEARSVALSNDERKAIAEKANAAKHDEADRLLAAFKAGQEAVKGKETEQEPAEPGIQTNYGTPLGGSSQECKTT